LLASVLDHLILDGSLNEYEVASQLADRSLRSSVSNLTNTYAMNIKRTLTGALARQPAMRYDITAGHPLHVGDTPVKQEQRKGRGVVMAFAQLRPGVATHTCWRYRAPVTVNPVTDLGRSIGQRRSSAQQFIASAFFASAMSRCGGCAWDTFGCAGFLVPGRPTRVQPSPLLAWPRALTAPPMTKELYR